MILFVFTGYECLFRSLGALRMGKGKFEIGRFENGELFVTLGLPVRMAHCVILGSIAPPDEQLLSFTLLGHTLKKEGAYKITALLPYLAYSRQDKNEPGRSLATAWVGL